MTLDVASTTLPLGAIIELNRICSGVVQKARTRAASRAPRSADVAPMRACRATSS
jgi:hypothetical protein